MRVLFCTDGSHISIDTLKNASHWIKNAVLDIICVIDWTFLPEAMSIEKEDYEHVYESVADRVLDYAGKIAIENNLVVGEKIKRVGSAVEGILEQLKEYDYAMVLVGSHGKKGLQKWIGSVSRQIVHNSKLPVYVSKETNARKKVLFPIDGSDNTCKAIQQALKLIDLKDKDVYFCMVLENYEFIFVEATLDPNWLKDIDKEQEIEAAKAIKLSRELISSNNVEIKDEAVLRGNPAQAIIDYASKNEIDLIVMGSQSRDKMSEFLIGSVSKRVLENTFSDVLILRQK